ncbi:hypothetical protein B0H12DRAFT_1154854 [Mycena haematopus]|nr:hypothetical protein B0H12DRAFT_1154854 [Mycena haematopus]
MCAGTCHFGVDGFNTSGLIPLPVPKCLHEQARPQGIHPQTQSREESHPSPQRPNCDPRVKLNNVYPPLSSCFLGADRIVQAACERRTHTSRGLAGLALPKRQHRPCRDRPCVPNTDCTVKRRDTVLRSSSQRGVEQVDQRDDMPARTRCFKLLIYTTRRPPLARGAAPSAVRSYRGMSDGERRPPLLPPPRRHSRLTTARVCSARC